MSLTKKYIFHLFDLLLIADYPSYRRGEKQIGADNYYLNQNEYQRGFDNRDNIREEDSDWFIRENDNERTEEDQNLGPYLPVEGVGQDKRVHDDGPLPPINPENWGEINAKHGLKENSHSRLGKTSTKNYKKLKSKQHIRQGEVSSNRAVHSVRDQQDSSENYNYNEYENLRQFSDSESNNVDSSSKKSEILSSEGVSTDSEKRMPPVPLSREFAPDPSDNSGLQDNHMQTEKQASRAEAADTKAREGKIMVKGKVKQVKADIDQGPNPEKTYKRVEDFFQSQRESSIVEVPNAVKKEEASKLYKDNFIPVKDAKDEVSKEQGENCYG